MDRDGGQTIAHHPQWPGPGPGPVTAQPPHGARPVPVPPGLHPPQPPAQPSTSRQTNGSQSGEGVAGAGPGGVAAMSPPNTFPTGATLSYREDGRVGGDGQSWVGPGPGRGVGGVPGADQAAAVPVCQLPMPEFWCSIAYFELDTQVPTECPQLLILTDNSARLVRFSKFPAPARLLLLTAMLIRVRATGSVWGL